MIHSLRKAYAGWKCARCGRTYPTKEASRGEPCTECIATLSGRDQHGRLCSVTYEMRRIARIDVGASSALIYTDLNTPDLTISLRDYRRIKPLLTAKTKITGDAL
jgi:hypothetical protein